jgi:rubrerythrin
MTLNHKALVELLQKAYSAEKAAAFAYQGHAGSVNDPDEKAAIHQIEIDEWNHRKEVLEIMEKYRVPVSKFYEFRFMLLERLFLFRVM